MSSSSQIVALTEYIKSFPFIETWVYEKGSPLDVRVSVQRIDLDVLNLRPINRSANGAIETSYYIISNGGRVFSTVKKEHKDYSSRSFWHPSTWFGHNVYAQSVEKTIADAEENIANLKKYKVDTKLRYLVNVTDNYNHISSGVRFITIYKIPSNFSLKDFIKDEQQKIRDRVNEQISKSQ